LAAQAAAALLEQVPVPAQAPQAMKAREPEPVQPGPAQVPDSADLLVPAVLERAQTLASARPQVACSAQLVEPHAASQPVRLRPDASSTSSAQVPPAFQHGSA